MYQCEYLLEGSSSEDYPCMHRFRKFARFSDDVEWNQIHSTTESQ